MPKVINVKVTTVDAELEFAIQTSTLGKNLFDQVVKTVGLREVWYFGLQYTDSKGYPSWLKLSKKVLSEDIKKENPLQFKFLAKYYPEDVAEELIQNVTKKIFFLQVKEGILSGDIFCSPETAILLASYACQARFGDYEDRPEPGFIDNIEKYIPSRVLQQYTLTKEEWENKIINWYKELKGTWPEDAMLEYLKICQDLEMYGVNYFEIKNKKQTPLWLGVDALGVNVYGKEDQLTPKIGFPWSEIRNISFNDKKFILKPLDKKAPDFIFYASHLRVNKTILSLCMGNHELYIRRRKPETIEVQQMKTQTKEEKEAKLKEHTKFVAERNARESAEKQRVELEDKLMRLERLNIQYSEERQQHEQKINELSKRLNEENQKLKDLQEAKLRSEEITKQLEHDKFMAQEERERLQLQNESIIAIISNKEEEALRSQLEVQKMQEELQRVQEERLELEAKARRYEEEQLLKQEAHESDDKNEFGADLQNMEGGVNDRSEEDRETWLDKDIWIQKQMTDLSAELEQSRDTTKVQKIDRIHEENQRQGRDKFKTLRQIRQGNTKKRVDEFEAL